MAEVTIKIYDSEDEGKVKIKVTKGLSSLLDRETCAEYLAARVMNFIIEQDEE